jgi:hypothetical protein
MIMITYAVIAMFGGIGLFIASAAIFYSPNNHWSFDIRWCWIAVPAGLIWLIIVWACKWISKSLCSVLMLTIFLSALIIFVVDRLNLLVDYDVWTARGMPDRWEITSWK